MLLFYNSSQKQDNDPLRYSWHENKDKNVLENGHRWCYSADIQQDLLGTRVLECRWGRIGSRIPRGQRFLTDAEGEARENGNRQAPPT